MSGPFLLIVLDGFGLAPPGPGNAVSLADTPVLDRLFAECPWTGISASSADVGLPDCTMGNSEVGHLNIGAGRAAPQDVVRIDATIDSGAFFDNEALRAAVASAAATADARLHLMGLYSDGNVHASDRHVSALVELASRSLPADRILLHVFTDGRDTPPRSAEGYVDALIRECAGKATIATVSGRYYAMDRDNRWERVERAWRAIVYGEGREAPDAVAAVTESYERGQGDEFVEPTVVAGARGLAPFVRDGDSAIYWNFRADRARQMCHALADTEFDGFDRGAAPPSGLHITSLTSYEGDQVSPYAFPPVDYDGVLAQIWSQHGLRQLRIAETEKYAHVTYFFSGGRERELEGERRILVPSPRVATYDLQPEMSAAEVTDRLMAEIEAESFDAAVLNLANCDMVGHTGSIPETRIAVETVDRCLGRLVDAIVSRGGTVIVTADHGNCEQMVDPDTGGVHTAHTLNPVPAILCGVDGGVRLREGGRLADLAPTALELMGLPRPDSMSGRSLIETP